jgi:hypothetical protein
MMRRVDPDDVSLIVDAVVAGATASAKETATTGVVEDSFAALITLLARRRVDAAALQREPDSRSARDALRIDLRKLAPDQIDDVLATARRLVQAIAAPEAERLQTHPG